MKRALKGLHKIVHCKTYSRSSEHYAKLHEYCHKTVIFVVWCEDIMFTSPTTQLRQTRGFM